jgi:hypothetical protein
MPMTGYYDSSAGFNMMTQLFLDIALQDPIISFAPNRFYYNQTDGVTFQTDPSGRIQMTFKC